MSPVYRTNSRTYDFGLCVQTQKRGESFRPAVTRTVVD